jgi:solute carrier family 25 (mitochondrial adenine nucleotide translocator), member 4/5/6/31
VKIVLQTQYINEQLVSSVRYKGPYDCMRRIYLEEGAFSFWRGNLANVIRYPIHYYTA